MAENYLQIRKLVLWGQGKESALSFPEGVNSICGASDTDKSSVAESLDFVLGGEKSREIVGPSTYTEIKLYLVSNAGKRWCLHRAVAGGKFTLTDLDDYNLKDVPLKQRHVQGKRDNLSGSMLEQLGLFDKKILKSRDKVTIQGLSFRNLARLALIQEGGTQKKGSPFLSDNPTNETSELATLELLLTGVSDASIGNIKDTSTDTSAQIVLIDEFTIEPNNEIDDLGIVRSDTLSQFSRLEQTIILQHNFLASQQDELNNLLLERRKYYESKDNIQKRLDEISELLARFTLLYEHYVVNTDRLRSIQESGLIFMHIEAVPCPHCGANPDHQDLEKICDGGVSSIINSATAEIVKIETLLNELNNTISDLHGEERHLKKGYSKCEETCQHLDKTIRDIVAPKVNNFNHAYTVLVDKKSEIQRFVDLSMRRERLEKRKADLLNKSCIVHEKTQLEIGPSDSVVHNLSLKISFILKAWNFPGGCSIFSNKVAPGFVIGGKPRGSRGKGLRAVTHAAASVALLEFYQEEELSHPGFLVLGSPLLAHYKPEGGDNVTLRGTGLKEKFCGYLSKYHTNNSQTVAIGNPYPPEGMGEKVTMAIFISNPKIGRQGLL